MPKMHHAIILLTAFAMACGEDTQAPSSPWELDPTDEPPVKKPETPQTPPKDPTTPPKRLAYSDFCTATVTLHDRDANPLSEPQRITQTFDVRGLKQHVEVFKGDTKTAEHLFEYNPQGQLLTAKMYRVHNDEVFLVAQQQRQYHSNGAALLGCQSNIYESSGDSVFEEIRQFAYDSEGRVIKSTKNDDASIYGYGDHAITEQRTTQRGTEQYQYAFDGAGRFTTYQYVEGEIVEQQKRSSSEQLDARYLINATSRLDNQYLYSDEQLSKHITKLFLRDNAQPHIDVSRTFNAQGRLSRYDRDYRGDQSQRVYRYERNRVKVYALTKDAASLGALLGEYVYDDQGNLLEVWRDGRGDGQTIRKTTFSYDCFKTDNIPPKLAIPRAENTYATPWYRKDNAHKTGPAATCSALALSGYYTTEWVTPSDALQSTGIFGDRALFENINPNLIP